MHHWKEKFNFKIGHPPDETANIENVKKSILHSFERFNDKEEENYTYRFLNYGNKFGDLGLRKELAKWNTEDFKFKVNPDNIFISGGSSQGFDLLCCALLKPGDNVLIEGPTYYLFLKTFSDHHVNVTTVLRNEDGTYDLDKVEKIIVEKNIKAFYTIATCHNPTGTHLPLDQRNRLWNMSLKYKCYMFVDDVYECFFYDYGVKRLPPMFYCSDEVVAQKEKHHKEVIEYDHDCNPFMISINSFNKLINPGFRAGWIVAHTSVLDKIINLGYIASGGGIINTMNQFIRSFIELGYIKEAIKFTQDNFRHRIVEADKVLKGSDAYSYDYPTGGYFFWIKLSNKVNLEKLKKLLADEDCHVLFGESTVNSEAIEQEEFKHLYRRMRLCFTRHPLDFICKGFALVRKLIEQSVDQ